MIRQYAPFAALLCLLVIAGCRGNPMADHPGHELYIDYCAVCHGDDGRSLPDMNSTPHLDSQGLLTSVDDEFLRASISRGRPGENGRGKPGTKMSAFGAEHGGPLAASEVDLLVDYIRQWQTEAAVELPPVKPGGDPAAGQVLYDKQCLACHMADGWSTIAPSLAGEVLQETATDALIRHTVINGRPGSAMPGLALDETELADLVAYVRTLHDPGSADPRR